MLTADFGHAECIVDVVDDDDDSAGQE